MPLLVVLRDLQRIVVAGEIGAGILPVGIEKKAEQLVREVVMVRHLLLRPSDGVVVLDVGDSTAETFRHSQQGRHPPDIEIAAAKVEEVVKRRAVLERQRAVPIGRSAEHTSELQSLMRISYAV